MGAPLKRARGIDVSKYQDPARLPYALWFSLGYLYAFINIAIGLLRDFRALEHRERLLAAGYLTGPYQALHELDDPRAQARLLIESRDPRDRMPNLADIERKGLTEAWARAFCDEYDAQTDVELWIYTGPGAWANIVKANHQRYAKYGLFCADYGFVNLETDRRSDPPPGNLPRLPRPWTRHAMWQYAGDNGRLPGYASGIDLSELNGTAEELYARYGDRQPSKAHLLAELEKIAGASASVRGIVDA